MRSIQVGRPAGFPPRTMRREKWPVARDSILPPSGAAAPAMRFAETSRPSCARPPPRSKQNGHLSFGSVTLTRFRDRFNYSTCNVFRNYVQRGKINLFRSSKNVKSRRRGLNAQNTPDRSFPRGRAHTHTHYTLHTHRQRHPFLRRPIVMQIRKQERPLYIYI